MCNSQNGNTPGSHWAPSIAFSPICESVFHTQTHFLGLMGPCISHLITNPMLKLQQHVNGGAHNPCPIKKGMNAHLAPFNDQLCLIMDLSVKLLDIILVLPQLNHIQ